jgi:hypothetical protein
MGGDTPNQHDMLTGSTLDGRAFPANMNLTCSNSVRHGALHGMDARCRAMVKFLLEPQ